jgi:SAM-dependent methyltransferase
MDYSAHYARFHPDTAAHDSSLDAILKKWLVPNMPASRASSVLDVGCGRGYALRLLRDLGYCDLSGIDIDAGQVDFARSKGLGVERVGNSPDYLNARRARYDVVLLMDLLEHLAAAEQATMLAAIRNALRPGGRLICTVPNAASPVASYMRHVDYTHQTSFTLESLHFALSQSEFRVEWMGGAEFFFRPRFLFWLPSQRTLQWILLCLVRARWRFTYLAELGFAAGWKVPLAPNLIALAFRQ